MGALAAGAVQEAHHGAVQRKGQDLRAASHACGSGFPVGVSLQTVSSLPHTVLILLFLTPRWQFVPSNRTPEGLMMPIHHELEVETVSPWLQVQGAKCFLLKSFEISPKRHLNQSRVQAASKRTMFFFTISTSTTSRDSTPRCTWTGHPVALRQCKMLKNAALKGNCTYNGAIAEIGLGSVQSVAQICCRRTLKEQTDECLKSWWRVRLKRVEAPGKFTFVADLNTLMWNVYIPSECLSEPKAQKPLLLKSVHTS